jgi:hypothetical protein
VGGGAVQVFSSLGLCCGGYGTIEIVGGCGPFFFAVFSLLSAPSAGGCLWWGSIFPYNSFIWFYSGIICRSCVL